MGSIRSRQGSFAADQMTDHDLRAFLFDSTVLPALCSHGRHWMSLEATSKLLNEPLRDVSLKFNRRTQHLTGLRSSDLRGMSVFANLRNMYRKQNIDGPVTS
ncbi:hypothetical protein RB195_009743 [Necator americanus]|uniref:Uncharacterized protein n=1 Tax=Necator americanus TaxID=51031 RepID=A0ABR1CUP9_NECAM